MEQDENKVIEFLETVYEDMKMRHTYTGVVNLSSPDRARAGQYSKFQKQLNMMYRALNPMHTAAFETLFNFLKLNEENGFLLFSMHCSKIWEEVEGLIDVSLNLMYTCSFTFSFLAFCESKGNPNFLSFFTRWIMNVYPHPIEPKLHSINGWIGLNKFCSTLNLYLIIDFINLCYNEHGRLFTPIKIEKSFFFFGVNNDDTILILKNNFQNFKKSVFAEFKNDINSNLKYKFAVMLSFIKMELAFDLTASTYNPPSPPRRVLYPTLDFFDFYLWDSIKHEIPPNIKRAFLKQQRERDRKERSRIRRERARAIRERSYSTEEEIWVNGLHDFSDEEETFANQKEVCSLQGSFENQEFYTPQEAFDNQDVCTRQEAFDNKEVYTHQDFDNQKGICAQQEVTNQGKTPYTLDDVIAIVQQSMKAIKLAPANEVYYYNVPEDISAEKPVLNIENQISNEQTLYSTEGVPTIEEQTPSTEEQIYNTVEQASGFVEHSSASGFVEQASASGPVEQASASGPVEQASASGFVEQASASGFVEQASASGFVEQASASGFVEQAFGFVDQTSNTVIEQATGYLEQTSSTKEQAASDCVEGAFFGEEDKITNKREHFLANIHKYRRAVLVKYASEELISDSDTDSDSECHCRCPSCKTKH